MPIKPVFCPRRIRGRGIKKNADVGRMLAGTTEVLRLYGFPVGVAGTMTIVKKESEQDDELFKKKVNDYINRLGEVAAISGNEPADSNILHARFPKAASFLVMTRHKPDAPALNGGIQKIDAPPPRRRRGGRPLLGCNCVSYFLTAPYIPAAACFY